MKKHTAIVIILVIIVGFVAFWILGNKKAAAPAESTIKTTQTVSPEAATASDCPVMAAPTISYENGSFTPKCVTVTSGTSVTWSNKGALEIQLGADPHPAHTGNKEVSNGEYVLSIAAGAQATTKLTTTGNHGYHNHLNPEATGKIIVQ